MQVNCAISFGSARLCGLTTAGIVLGIPVAVHADVVSPTAPAPFPLLLLATLCFVALGVFTYSSSRQHKRSEDSLRSALRQAELRGHTLLDNAGDAVFLIDARNFTIQELNLSATTLLGYTLNDVAERPFIDLIPRSHHPRYLALIKKLRQEGYGEAENLTLCHKDGARFSAAIHARLSTAGSEEIIHAVIRDASPRLRSEQDLRKKLRDLTLINKIAYRAASSTNLPQMLRYILDEVIRNFEVDGGGVYLLRHEGQDLELLVDKGIPEEVLHDLREIMPKQGLVGRVIATGHARTASDLSCDRRLHSQSVRTDGWGGFHATPLVSNAKVVGVLFIFCRRKRLFRPDESRLLRTIGRQAGGIVEKAELIEALEWQQRLNSASYRELEISRQQLKENLWQVEENNRILARLELMKNHFLALASHELRTPLTFILSSAQFLGERLKGRLHDEEWRGLDAIVQGGMRLNELVEDLLEVARLESQSIYLAKEEISLVLLLDHLRKDFAPLAAEGELTLDIEAPAVPWHLQGDFFYLQKSFTRLLENAIKFTPRGGHIAISSTCRGPLEVLLRKEQLEPFSPQFFLDFIPRTFVQLTISDTGIGINPDDHVRIFDKFYEGGDIHTHSSAPTPLGGKGAGLGLALVKGMIEAHGGMVWVESSGKQSLNAGSAFHVLLPITSESQNETA